MSWIISHLWLLVSGLGIGGLGVLGFLFPQVAGEIGLGLLYVVKAVLRAVGRFLSDLDMQGWVGLVCTLSAVIFGLHELSEGRHWHKQSDRYQQLYTREHAAFGQTVLNYRNAATKAAADDKANAERVKSQQNQISQEQSDGFQTRLAAARAEYERLSRAPTSHSGNSPSSPMSGVSPPVAGPDEAAGQDGLPDRYICTAQSIQLDALERWVTAQHNVDPNKEGK